MTASTQRHERPWMHGAAGMLGGALAMTLFYPLDFLRTRMHTLHQGTRALPMRSVREIVHAEGLRSMYRGLGVAVVSHSVGWGMYLVTFRAAQRRCDVLFADCADTVPASGKDFLSACVAATVTGTLITPLHVIKTRRQLCIDASCARRGTGAATTTAATAKTASVTACGGVTRVLRSMVREEGYAALYKGLGPQILLTGNTTLQVTLYEALRRRCFTDVDNPAPWQVAAASAVSKAVSTALFNPLEVVRTRMQDSRNAHSPEYRSMAAGLRTLWRSEGAAGLYRGLPVNVARVMPSTVAAFVLYEKCLWLMRTVHTRMTHGGGSSKSSSSAPRQVSAAVRSLYGDDDGDGGSGDEGGYDSVLSCDVLDVAIVGMCTRRPLRRRDDWVASRAATMTAHGQT